MAEPKNKTFNLLYKIESQKSFVDRMYEFVIGPARIVVIGVMLVIIIAFLIRFPLDSSLNDQVKLARSNSYNLNSVLNSQEKEINSTTKRIETAKKFENMYKDPLDPTKTGGNYKLSYVLSKILAIKSNYSNDLILSSYNVSNDGEQTIIKIYGGSTTFEKVDAFINDIRTIDVVSDASSVSQSGQRGQIPKFSIDIKIKK